MKLVRSFVIGFLVGASSAALGRLLMGEGWSYTSPDPFALLGFVLMLPCQLLMALTGHRIPFYPDWNQLFVLLLFQGLLGGLIFTTIAYLRKTAACRKSKANSEKTDS